VAWLGNIFEFDYGKNFGNSFQNQVGYRYCPGKTKVLLFAIDEYHRLIKYDGPLAKPICKI